MILNVEKNIKNYPGQKLKENKNISFKGPIDGVVTQTLMAINTNPMINAAAVDVGSMVIPRTYIDTKKRNKYAGFETFFRELTGTVIVCLSAGVAAMGIASIHNKSILKEINIKPKIWATNETFDALRNHWEKSEKNVNKYIKNIFSDLSGSNGKNIEKWNDINWNKVNWYDDSSWSKIKWDNNKWKNIASKTKDGDQIIEVFSELIKDKSASKKDVKNVIKILEQRISNSLRADQSINISSGDKSISTNLRNLIRDAHDLGKEIFGSGVDLNKAEHKLKSMNKLKSTGAVGLVSLVGLGNQSFNRYLTKKRTGKDDFVGENNYENSKIKKDSKAAKQQNLRLIGLKAVASLGFLALALRVMKVKNPKEFLKKIELKSAVTSGNAIKTIFTATLIGRFLAARNETELRESCTRDYLAFFNWLVLGNFVSKGVAQLLDKKQENLFNVIEDGSKGIKKWFNNVSLKSYREIAANGGEFAKKNVWKLNVANAAGLLYSGIALGCAIPLLNIFITNRKNSKTKPLEHQTSNITFGMNNFPKVFENFYGNQIDASKTLKGAN